MADISSGGAGGLLPQGGESASEQVSKQVGESGGGVPGVPGVPGTPPGVPTPPAIPGTPGVGGLNPSDTGGGGSAASADATTGAGADKQLGAGGVQQVSSGDGMLGDVEGGKGSGAAKAAGVAAAVPAAGVAGQVMVLAMFINWLKGLAMAMAAIAANLWNLVLAAAMAVVTKVAGFFLGIGAGISSVVGGGISAVVAGATTFVAGSVTVAIVVVGLVVGVNQQSELTRADGLISCVVPAEAALSEIEGSEVDSDALVTENAKKIYSVLGAWGMPDENIAGIIGNWQAESGIDPTRVQNSANAPYTISPEEQTAAENLDNGIGLGQWTFGRNQALRDYASGHTVSWGTIETQLGFMVSAAEGGNADIVRDMIANSKGTPGEAAIFFHDEWERSADTAEMAQRRADYANQWMGKFSGWTIDQALADSILAQAGTTIGEANSTRAADVRSECLGVEQGSLSLKDGGMSLEEAQKLMDLYISEGESFLQARYPGGAGPGDCGYGKADNCVGFSTYFVNKYTSFERYAPGNGIDTAGSMANLMGKETSNTPTAYSVVSGPGSGPEGHTFVVLGIQGDQAVIGEAACGTNHRGTQARLMPISELTNGSYTFVDVTDLILDDPMA